jgi:hypothetical protein
MNIFSKVQQDKKNNSIYAKMVKVLQYIYGIWLLVKINLGKIFFKIYLGLII